METQERLWDVDDLWDLVHQQDDDSRQYELIDGVLIEMSRPGGEHGEICLNLGSYIRAFAREHGLGRATVETGYHPPDNRNTLLGPDIAFVRHTRAPTPFPKRFVPVMPDLAVEILSPSDTIQTMRNKARIYSTNGTSVVWIILPAERSVEIHQTQQPAETRGFGDSLSGEDVLPGFALELRRLFT